MSRTSPCEKSGPEALRWTCGQLRVFDPHDDTTIAYLGVGKVIGEYGMFVEFQRTFSAPAEGQPVRR